MVFTQENIQFSESVVKYNLINFLNLLIDMGSLSGAGRLFHNIKSTCIIHRDTIFSEQVFNCFSVATRKCRLSSCQNYVQQPFRIEYEHYDCC